MEAPPSVTSTPPAADERLEVLQARPGEPARDVGRRSGGSVARELRRLREGEGPVARVDADGDVLQAAARVGEDDHVEPLAQASLAHVLVHDERVGDLLVVEDHPHPARGLRVAPGLEHGQAWEVEGVPLHVGGAARGLEVEAELRGHAVEGGPQSRLIGDDPGARRVVLPAGAEGLLRRLHLEPGQPHAGGEQRLPGRCRGEGRRRRPPRSRPCRRRAAVTAVSGTCRTASSAIGFTSTPRLTGSAQATSS